MKKCSLCGEKALEGIEICPECLKRAAVAPKQIKRLRQISNILSITADTDTNIKACMQSITEIMAKKRRNRKVIPFQQERTLTYNKEKPNRQARRLGIKPEEPKREEKKTVSKATVLSQKAKQAREAQRRITPPGMTYGEYMEYLKDKRQQLEEKKKSIQE